MSQPPSSPLQPQQPQPPLPLQTAPPGQPSPFATPAHAHAPAIACRLCGGQAGLAFAHTVLQKHAVGYYRCGQCGSLQTQTPYWLDEAYANRGFNLDTGALQRNIDNFASCFTVARLLQPRMVLDYGAKDGLLTRFLRDHGVDCHAYDKYADASYVKGFDAPPAHARFDLLMAFEVLEHLPNPAQDLDEIFRFDPSYIFFSTDLYTNQDADWWYLSPATGQHVFFYSPAGIHHIAQKYGYGVTALGSKYLFYKPQIPNVQQLIVACQTALSGWIFQAIRAFVFALPAKGYENDLALLHRQLEQQAHPQARPPEQAPARS